MKRKRVRGWMLIAGMILCLGWLVTGCATSQQLAAVQEQADQSTQTAEKALMQSEAVRVDVSKERTAAEAAAASAARDANRAEAAAGRAESAANRAEKAAGDAEAMAEKAENIFMKQLKK